MRPLVSVPVIGLSGALSCGCGVPVSDSKYEVGLTRPERIDSIVAAYTGGTVRCDEHLREHCRPSIHACADTAACTELTTCMRETANPGAGATCAARVDGATIDAVAAYVDVRECWERSDPDCAVGRDWTCLGQYTPPEPPEPLVTVRQTFEYLCEEGPVEAAAVAYCDRNERCKERASTDATGTYTLDIRHNGTTPEAGWLGFRRATHGDLAKPHRLERNLPIWGDLVESTTLMSEGCGTLLRAALETNVPSGDWESAIAVQVFDCQGAGAERAELVIPSVPDAEIVYVSNRGELSYGMESSLVAGEGLALIANVPAGEHQILAYEFSSGTLIGSGPLTVTGEDIILYSLLPAPAD